MRDVAANSRCRVAACRGWSERGRMPPQSIPLVVEVDSVELPGAQRARRSVNRLSGATTSRASMFASTIPKPMHNAPMISSWVPKSRTNSSFNVASYCTINRPSDVGATTIWNTWSPSYSRWVGDRATRAIGQRSVSA